MNNEKLTMSFSIWGIFDCGEDCVYHDWDSLMKEYVERGFNCIRLESGQGFLNDINGNTIEKLKFHPIFGKFSPNVRQCDVVFRDGVIDFRARLLELFRAADKYDVKIVLSSWFPIHTYWFFNESVTKPIRDLTLEEKIVHFAKDVVCILDLLKENDLLHCVAFVEIFNEMDGMPCNNPPIISLTMASNKYAEKVRTAHEEALDMIKAKHPSVKVAYDIYSAYTRPDLLPRNIDVLNFHSYYLWNLYQVFEQGQVTDFLKEPELPESVSKYLNMQITNDDILDEMKCSYINSVYSFVPRIRIYSDIKKEKLPEIEEMLENELRDNYDKYLTKMKENVDAVIEVRNKYVPNAELVMGEGVTYCSSNELRFEEKSELYWQLINEQAIYMRDKGFLGTVVRTTSGPEDPSWNLCKDKYIKANALFLGK